MLTPKKDEQPCRSLVKNDLAAPVQPPATDGRRLAFGAYQRGYYRHRAAARAATPEKCDTVAMTLLGELYANG